MRLSALDFMIHTKSTPISHTIQDTVQTMQIAEDLGFYRYWIPEHHNSYNTVASATAVIVQHLLAASSRIRIGAGGVMMPNHHPLLVAETYGTLYELYPDRIDLGIGRQPHSDEAVAQSLQRSSNYSVKNFSQAIQELQGYFAYPKEDQTLVAYPGIGAHLPLYILSGSTISAKVAGRLGLPYAFGAHMALPTLEEALRTYRENFVPSKDLDQPYVIVTALIDLPYDSITPLASLDHLEKMTAETKHSFSSFERTMLSTFHGLKLPTLEGPLSEILGLLVDKYAPDELMLVSLSKDREQTETAFRQIKSTLDSFHLD